MPTFSYTAVKDDGTAVRGIIDALDQDRASEKISQSGLYVTKIRMTGSYMSGLAKALGRRTVRRQDVIEFSNTVAFMLKAGAPITTTLEDLSDSSDDKHFCKALVETRKLIEQGSSFSDALAKQGIFPDILVRLAAIGEETGSLERSLQDVAEHLQRIETLVSAVKRALIYPLFALFTTGGALTFWLIFVLPQIMDAFAGMGLNLPPTTKLLMFLSTFTQENWMLLLAVPVVFVVFLKISGRFQKTRYYIDYALIRMPLFKLLNHNKLLALFTEQLRILTVAGITIDRALKITSEIIGNEVFRVAIERILEKVTSGNRLSDSLRKHAIFPALVCRLVDIGEKSGSLDTQLAFLSEHYLNILDDISDRLGKMIEPIIILVIGLMFLFIIVSLLMPVYDLVTKIQ